MVETASDSKPALVSKLSTKLKDRILDDVENNAYAGDGFELDSDEHSNRASNAIIKPIAAAAAPLTRLQTKESVKSFGSRKLSDLYQAKAKVDTWNTNVTSPIRRVVPLK